MCVGDIERYFHILPRGTTVTTSAYSIRGLPGAVSGTPRVRIILAPLVRSIIVGLLTSTAFRVPIS